MSRIEMHIPGDNDPNVICKIASDLAQAGITEGKVRLLQRPDGTVIKGKRGYPLLVETRTGNYVYKHYQFDPRVEQQILSKASGKVTPGILKLGKDYFVQAYLDPRIYPTLETIAARDFMRATALGGQGFAALAKLGIELNDVHFFDDAFQVFQQVYFVDFGWAKFTGQPPKFKANLITSLETALRKQMNSYHIPEKFKNLLEFGVAGLEGYLKYSRYRSSQSQLLAQGIPVFVHSFDKNLH